MHLHCYSTMLRLCSSIVKELVKTIKKEMTLIVGQSNLEGCAEMESSR